MRQRIFSWARKRSAPRGKSSGQSIVELGLMLPILALVIVGVVDLGRIYYAYITVVNVAREGARYAAAHPPAKCFYMDEPSMTPIKERARNEAFTSGISPGQLTIIVTCYWDDYANPSEQPVQVTAMYNFQMLTGYFLNFPPVRLRADATMQVFGR